MFVNNLEGGITGNPESVGFNKVGLDTILNLLQ